MRHRDCLIASKQPASIVTLNRRIAEYTSQPIGNSPKAAPYAVAASASGTGMPYTRTATTNAVASENVAARQAGACQIPRSRATTTSGRAARTTDALRDPATGAYTWVHCSGGILVD